MSKDGRYQDTELIVKEGFRSLLTSMPYNKITVDHICEAAAISKKTFYKYYSSKQDLLEDFYESEFLSNVYVIRKAIPVDKIDQAPLAMTTRDFEVFYENRELFCNLLQNYGEAELANLIIKLTEKVNRVIYEEVGLSGTELLFGAFFVASSGAMTKIRWMKNGFDQSPKELAALYFEWALSRLHVLMQDSPSEAK